MRAVAMRPPSSRRPEPQTETLAALPIYVILHGHFVDGAQQSRLSNVFRSGLDEYRIHMSDVELLEEPPGRYVIRMTLGVPSGDYYGPLTLESSIPAQRRLEKRLHELADEYGFTITSFRLSLTKPGTSTRTSTVSSTGPLTARTKAREVLRKATERLELAEARAKIAEEAKAVKEAKRQAKIAHLQSEIERLEHLNRE